MLGQIAKAGGTNARTGGGTFIPTVIPLKYTSPTSLHCHMQRNLDDVPSKPHNGYPVFCDFMTLSQETRFYNAPIKPTQGRK